MSMLYRSGLNFTYHSIGRTHYDDFSRNLWAISAFFWLSASTLASFDASYDTVT